MILRFRYEPPPCGGGVSSDPYVLKLFWWFSYVLKLFGCFLMYLRENWPPIGGQKILSISVMFLEANSFRNSNPFQNFRLRRHNIKQRISCYVHKSAFPIPSHCVHSYSSLMYIRAGFLSHLHTVHHTYCRVLHVCTQASYSVRSYSRVLLLCT